VFGYLSVILAPFETVFGYFWLKNLATLTAHDARSTAKIQHIAYTAVWLCLIATAGLPVKGGAP